MAAITLPEPLLVELGRAASSWGALEFQVKLATSAMASHATEGWPDDHLEMSFKQLRKKWFALALVHAGAHEADVKAMNDSLAALSIDRGLLLHGVWSHTQGEVYRLTHWVQHKPDADKGKAPESRLAIHNREVSLALLRDFVAAIEGSSRTFALMHG